MPKPWRSLIPLLMASLVVAFAGTARAQAYPTKPIRLIVGFAAGGSSDVMARTIAQQLAERLGQQVIVENKTGASGIIAADTVAKAVADGYTLLFGVPGPIVILPALGTKLPYDPIKDLVPVSLVANLPLALVVPSTLPAQNLKELLDLARTQPGKLNYASTGPGSVTHLGMEMLKYAAGVDIQNVSYKGQAAALPDLMAGTVQMMLDGWATTIPHVNSGKLRFIAVTTAQRSAVQPQVPTVAEQGFPGFNASPWYGVWAPAGTPQGVIAKLSAELVVVTSSPTLRNRFKELGIDPLTGDFRQFADFILSEQKRWADLIRQANIKVE